MNKIPKQKNVLGEDIEPCSMNPVTGWFRDGSCNTDKTDVGMHCVCAKVTDDFLIWCKENGNDLNINDENDLYSLSYVVNKNDAFVHKLIVHFKSVESKHT